MVTYVMSVYTALNAIPTYRYSTRHLQDLTFSYMLPPQCSKSKSLFTSVFNHTSVQLELNFINRENVNILL